MALELEGKKYVKVKKGGVTYNVINVRVVKNGVTYNVWGSGSSVTYVVDNGEAYSEDVLNGDSVLSPKTFTPSKSGYTFVGWRADKTASSSVLTSKTMGTEPITLYAVFKRTLTLTYYDGTTTKATKSDTQYYNNGNTANPSFTMTQASKTNWTARGWATSSDAKASINYNDGSTISIGSDTTIYGCYSQAITLSYNGNGASSGSTSKQTDTRYWNSAGNYSNPTFALASNGFSKTDYTFSKWAMGSANGTQYSAGSSVSLAENTTFYAVWSALSIYVIQNGSITKSDYVQSANFSALEVGADNFEENGNSMTAFVLKNAARFSRVKIRFKYRTYADYGDAQVIVNGTEVGKDEYQYDWKEHTMYIDSTTCTVQVYARNDSGNEVWGAAAGFQLLDVYLEV